MKKGLKVSTLLSIWLLFAISCRKHEDMAAGCISEVTVDPDSTANQVTPSQGAAIDNLFRLNNLSIANEQFLHLDSIQYLLRGYTDSTSEVEVSAYRWYYNFPVFLWSDVLIFYNDVFQPVISRYYTGQPPGPDTTFRQSLESLHHIFQLQYPPYLDSCLTAQPGYFDANYLDPATPAGTHLVKGWKVTPANRAFPMALVADNTGAAAWPILLFTD
jgi:hypothetical protein